MNRVSLCSKRRQILKLGAVAGVLALLPVSRRLAAAALVSSPSAPALGYWQGGAQLADFSSVHAGWKGACPKSARQCDTPLHDGLIDAGRLAGDAGDYRLRIIGAECLDVLSIDADYGVARHMLWRSWRQDEAVRHSGAVAVRWSAPAGEALPLLLQAADGAAARIAVPAQAGIYVLLPQAAEMDWTALALSAPDTSRPLDLRLQASSGRQPQYLLLAVERLVDSAAV